MTETDEGKMLWALPNAMGATKDKLRGQVEIYEQSVLLRTFSEDKNTVKYISAEDLADAFTQEISISSGMLPPETLWWNQNFHGMTTGLWRPPRVWPVAVQMRPFEPARRLKLPMPGLVFACRPSSPPRVYAAKERPVSEKDNLYRAPAYNVFGDGAVCPGTHSFPDDVNLIPESFFESFFSMTGNPENRSKSHPKNLIELWEELDGQDEYPLEDLVWQCNIESAMSER